MSNHRSDYSSCLHPIARARRGSERANDTRFRRRAGPRARRARPRASSTGSWALPGNNPSSQTFQKRARSLSHTRYLLRTRSPTWMPPCNAAQPASLIRATFIPPGRERGAAESGWHAALRIDDARRPGEGDANEQTFLTLGERQSQRDLFGGWSRRRRGRSSVIRYSGRVRVSR